MSESLTPTKFTDQDYLTLSHVFAGGDISRASKTELERYAVILSRPNAHVHFSQTSFPQVCETVRTLILVRMSEEANTEALRNSKVALYISIAALVATLVQAIADIKQLLHP